MSLLPGARAGSYEIVAAIGDGAMGQVYRARDVRLNRDVAVKVLPDEVARDPDRLSRFTREAQTLAALNHPNIAQVFGLEEWQGTRALVMELVEGEDLSQRIARGRLPPREALPIAAQIAEALQAAHDHGIIHRDLKPANVKVRSDGTVKVLDFGVAKAIGAPRVDDVHAGEMATRFETLPGIIIGTAAYMSPEQAAGEPVDRRCDIWSFGVVLMEMLTGRSVFRGETTAHVLAAVLKESPPLDQLPRETPAAVRRLLHRCLARNRKQRLDSAADARLEIEDALVEPASVDGGPPRVASATLPWAIAAASLLLAGVLATRGLRAPSPDRPETRVDIVATESDDPHSFALSPDERWIVYAAADAGPSQLWLRSLSDGTTQPLPGTEGASYPFWSPDSQSLGFFASAALKRLDIGGAAPRVLAAVAQGRGGTWTSDGTILFGAVNRPLMRVSSDGGAPAPVAALAPQQTSHRWPIALPGNRHFVFYVQGASDNSGIYLGSLDDTTSTRLADADNLGTYLPPGWLVWVKGTTLVAQRLAGRQLTGDLERLADDVFRDTTFRSAVSSSAGGMLAYRKREVQPRQLMWVDRQGQTLTVIGEPDSEGLSNPRAAPDGRRIGVGRAVQGNWDIWTMDDLRASRITTDPAVDGFLVWSPRGDRLVFSSARTGQRDLYETGANGDDAEHLLLATDMLATPTSWSPDGRFLLFHGANAQSDSDVWLLSIDGGRRPTAFLKSSFNESYGIFSPDGRWVAYQSNESGRGEVYVMAFSPPGQPAGAEAERRQVSTSGGSNPVWGPDGKELYFLTPAGMLAAVPLSAEGSRIEAGPPETLFSMRRLVGRALNGQGRQYDVASGGRILVNAVLDEGVAPITLVMNWSPRTKR
jgi:serine/threonine protein kinase